MVLLTRTMRLVVGSTNGMIKLYILTCLLVATRMTSVAVLPNLPPHPHPILNLQRTESEKIGQQN